MLVRSTNLLLISGSWIIFVEVLVLVFSALLEPAGVFLDLLPPLTFLLFFFAVFLVRGGGEGGAGGREGREAFTAFLSSGVR